MSEHKELERLVSLAGGYVRKAAQEYAGQQGLTIGVDFSLERLVEVTEPRLKEALPEAVRYARIALRNGMAHIAEEVFAEKLAPVGVESVKEAAQ